MFQQDSHYNKLLPFQSKQGLKKITLESNYYRVSFSNLQSLSIMMMETIPEIKNTNEQKLALVQEKCREKICEIYQNPIFLGKLIFIKEKVKKGKISLKVEEYLVKIFLIINFAQKNHEKNVIKLLNYLTVKTMSKKDFVEIAILKKVLNMQEKTKIGNTFIFSGYRPSYHFIDNAYFLKVDHAYKIVRDETVLQFMNTIWRNNIELQKDEKRELIRKEMIGQIIMTNYGKPRYFTVEDVIFQSLKDIRIESQNIPLIQYYQDKYNIKIKNFNQPLLFTNSKNISIKTYLVPEFCLMAGVSKKPDWQKAQQMAISTKGTVQQRKSYIQDFQEKLKSCDEDQIFPKLGIMVNKQCEKIDAFVVPLPKIISNDGEPINLSQEGFFHIQNFKQFNYVQKLSLIILKWKEFQIQGFLSSLQNGIMKLNLSLYFEVMEISNSANIISAISAIIDKVKSKFNMCLIILPNKFELYYKKIKQQLLLKQKILSQIVLQSTLKKKEKYIIVLRILFQMLAKLGNSLWSSQCEEKNEGILMVGIFNSLSHGKKNGNNLSICATFDEKLSRYFSKSIRIQNNEDNYQQITELIFQAVQYYYDANNYQLPKEIIIVQKVAPTKKEADLVTNLIMILREKVLQLMSLNNPKFTYIYLKVKKNDRFFYKTGNHFKNPPLGTIVNQQNILNRSEFFLISHSFNSKKGSIQLNFYEMVYSESDLSSLSIQNLLFSQAFTYFNYEGSIKMPAFVNNAIKCGIFEGEILENEKVDKIFVSKPFYL